MQFYIERHRHTCGVDLHGRNLYLCVLDPGSFVLSAPESSGLGTVRSLDNGGLRSVRPKMSHFKLELKRRVHNRSLT